MRKDNKKIKAVGSRVVDTLLIMSSDLLPALLLAALFFMGGRQMKYREEFGYWEVRQSPVELQNEIAFLFAIGALKHKEGHEQKVSDGPGIGGDMRLARADNLQLGSAG